MINYTKDLETGVAKIDEQHKELIKRINDFVSSGMNSITKDETEKTLNFLGDYAVMHFRDEEAMQKLCGYPKYEWHKGLHQSFLDEFQKLKKEYAQNGPSPAFTLNLNKYVIDWIVKHIKSVDVELGKFYSENMKG